MVKKLLVGIFLLLVLAVMAGHFFFKDAWFKQAMQQWVFTHTGFALLMDDLDISLFRQVIHVNKATLINPSDFDEREALVLNELFIHFDLASLFTDRIHVREARVDVTHITVVKLSDGRTNIDRLIEGFESAFHKPETGDLDPEKPVPEEPEPEEHPKKPSKKKTFVIDNLTLAFGKGEYVSYADHAESPTRRVVELNKTMTFQNLSEVRQIFHQIIVDVAMDQGVKGLKNLLLGNKDKLGVKEEEINKAADALGSFLQQFKK